MSQPKQSFLPMVVLAFVLMGFIVITQLFTNRATLALKEGNVKAVETFKVNSSIQQLVNLSFELQSKITKPNALTSISIRNSLLDSLTMLGYNANILIKKIDPNGKKQYTRNLEADVNTQLNLSYSLINNYNNQDIIKQSLDSIKSINPGEKVYSNCLSIQKMLENDLQKTLIENSNLANKLSTYNRILAILSILVIVSFATIIISRQAQQLNLIKELQIAREAALNSQKAKDEFLANMSHELRTPLNAIIGFGNLLKESSLPGKQKEYVEIINSSSNNLLSIVNDVLDLSKIEAGKLVIKNEPFHVKELLKSIEQLFSELVREKHLYFSCIIDENVPATVLGDKEKIKQILVNLISNAIKFTAIGGIKIEVQNLENDTFNHTCKLSITVKDTGAGIPSDKLDTIFERFEQLEHITTRQHGGTGLGLTIVKNLVEKLGGTITVDSQDGVGSAFTFKAVMGIPDEANNNTSQSRYPASVSLHNSRILVVDDNIPNSLLVKHILEKHSAIGAYVYNGIEAISLLRKESFDLILMDIQMSVMDGFTAIQKIKEYKLSTAPIIAMTAYVTEIEVEKCKAAGFDAYIPKPIDEKTLTEKIAYLLSNNNSASDTAIASNYLHELFNNDPTLIDSFLTELDIQWQKDESDLINAIKRNDEKSIASILHRIRSTFSALGPKHKIYSLLSSVEEKNHDSIREAVKQINTLIKEEKQKIIISE